ncbi:pEARLI1-like lipid transfer protein 1 [Hibiscus syriacus]|uniref:PEARLI1-like lipid transfer protein 1 n=1 Tax=Hibiscus syriacus TaxID=106335 RepID=A0A6A2YJE0_HIBSY|nr:pEARLI1-like lipid transfer protein 1 [Hibiscus syriacus]
MQIAMQAANHGSNWALPVKINHAVPPILLSLKIIEHKLGSLMMGKYTSLIVLLPNLGAFLTCLACPECPLPTPPPNFPPKHLPIVKPPFHPKPPKFPPTKATGCEAPNAASKASCIPESSHCEAASGGDPVSVISSSAKDTCCPVLQGLLDLDAAICLCTAIKAKLLNINVILPIGLQVLIDCGKTTPPGFQCPA